MLRNAINSFRSAILIIQLSLAGMFLGVGCCVMSGCSGRGGREVDSAAILDSIYAAEREANDITNDALAYADSVLQTLSMRRKVGMLYMPSVFAKADPYNMRHIMKYARRMNVGGIVLLKGDLNSAAEIADSLAALDGPGLFIALDAENGLQMRFPDAPEFPWSRELGRLTDDQLLYEFGYEIARECRAVGINMVLGPVMDVVPGDVTHGLMHKRSLGSDPHRVAELALAYAHGVEDGNVLTVAKHFPGHGAAKVDSHMALGIIRGSREEIDSLSLYPFRRYAAEGLSGVMVGHLSVEALDSVMRPAVASPVVMKDILRGELGFKGLVITDAINMAGAMGVKGWRTIAAGADMVIAPIDTEGEIQATLDAIADGELSMQTVDDRVRRILFYKYLVGLGEPGRRREGAAPGASEGGMDVVMLVNADALPLRDSIIDALHRHKNNTLRK